MKNIILALVASSVFLSGAEVQTSKLSGGVDLSNYQKIEKKRS